ncbi:predicted protein [Streptomyces viridosporus ATCC 14672]|uniref:Predicted protein n=1 Tax=Streptomyces viridosporus (strain ATCC 14672 / DSM 40746 / JCM 4963 / KCTC 9882 / NRRL B-12104 / FH 1290) TaxID=566461 RepID=D6A9V2_STRV1|nr:predicted protein [Streptomyces viridosporus ATCC 14672]
MGDDHSALEHRLLDFPERQREAVIPPHAVGNDLDRVPVPLVRRRRGTHEQTPSRSDRPEEHPTGAPQRDSASAQGPTDRRAKQSLGAAHRAARSAGSGLIEHVQGQ